MLKRSLLLIALLSCLVVSASMPATGKPFDVTVSFKGTGTPDQIEFALVLKDAKSHSVVFAPKVITKLGEPAKASSIDKEGREFTFSVTFDKTGRAGTYEVVVAKDGKELQKDEGTFKAKC